jgi:hypothetical protein
MYANAKTYKVCRVARRGGKPYRSGCKKAVWFEFETTDAIYTCYDVCDVPKLCSGFRFAQQGKMPQELKQASNYYSLVKNYMICQTQDSAAILQGWQNK